MLTAEEVAAQRHAWAKKQFRRRQHTQLNRLKLGGFLQQKHDGGAQGPVAKLDYLTPVRLDREARKDGARKPLDMNDIVERARRRARQQDQLQAFSRSATAERKNWAVDLTREIESFRARPPQASSDARKGPQLSSQQGRPRAQPPASGSSTDIKKQSIAQHAQVCIEILTNLAANSFLCEVVRITAAPTGGDGGAGPAKEKRRTLKRYYGDETGREQK